MTSCGIVFDCDGTLMDSLGYALESFNYALENVGAKPETLQSIKRYFGAGADKIFLNLLKDEQKANQAFEHYLEIQTRHSKTTRLHQGIEELLDRIAEAKIPMAVVTGRHSRDLEIVMKPHAIKNHFKTLITDDLLSRPKPAPDGILKAAERLQIHPSRIFYVGDAPTDIQAAHAAGSYSVAALWDSLAHHDELSAEKPTFIAKTPSEVWVQIQKKLNDKK